MLSKARKRLNLTSSDKTALLEDLIEEVGYRILHFCRRDDIPVALEYTWLRMVIEAYEEQTAPSAQAEGTFVSSISEGDTTIGYSQFTNGATRTSSLIDDLVLNYKIDLVRYRKLRGLQ